MTKRKVKNHLNHHHPASAWEDSGNERKLQIAFVYDVKVAEIISKKAFLFIAFAGGS